MLWTDIEEEAFIFTKNMVIAVHIHVFIFITSPGTKITGRVQLKYVMHLNSTIRSMTVRNMNAADNT